MEYLYLWVTRDGVQPIYKKISNANYDATNLLNGI